jgi:general secretion pathway protein G
MKGSHEVYLKSEMSRPVGARASRRREAGYTLLELLIVIAILGVLAALVGPQLIKYLGRAKTDTARLQLEQIATSLDLYRLDVGHYPTQQEGLNALITAPPTEKNWAGPYVKKARTLSDPWGNPVRYVIPGQHGEYDLYSLGADDAEGGEGENADVTGWSSEPR